MGADLYNRQYHPDEQQKLAELQKGKTPEERRRLADAACYLVRCAAQLPSNDPAQAAALASQQRGAGFVSEQGELKSTGLFVYSRYDLLNDPLSQMGGWTLQHLKSAGRGAANLGDQFVDKMNADAQAKMSESLADLVAQGVANGVTTVLGAGGGKPPAASTSAVLADSTAGQVAGGSTRATIGMPGYVPSHATLNSSDNSGLEDASTPVGGGGGQASGSVGSRANSQVKNTDNITIDGKIGGQLEARGWTQQEVQVVVNKGAIGTTLDSRSAAKTPDGLPRNDTASVYGSKSGYVVVNDHTGEVVQVSGKNDPGWIPDSRIKWK